MRSGSFIAASSLMIAVLGFLVWGHHMFVSGQSTYAAFVFSFLSFLVAIPSAGPEPGPGDDAQSLLESLLAVRPGKDGEVWFVDAVIQQLKDGKPIYAYPLTTGQWLTVGDPEGYRRAVARQRLVPVPAGVFRLGHGHVHRRAFLLRLLNVFVLGQAAIGQTTTASK